MAIMRNKVFAKLGVDETLSDADKNTALTTAPFVIDTIDAKIDESYGGNTDSPEFDRAKGIGAAPTFNTSPMTKGSFKTHIFSSGTPGTPPVLGSLLRAAGFSETIDATAGTVTYEMVDNGHESMSIGWLLQELGLVQPSHGCRAEKLSMEFGSGSMPTADWGFAGSYHRPYELTSPPAELEDYTGWHSSQAFTVENVPVITVGTLDECFESVSVDMGIQSVWEDSPPKCRGQLITGFEPKISTTLKASKKQTVLDVYPMIETHKASITAPFNMQLGKDAGSIVVIECDKVQWSSSGFGENDKQRNISLEGACQGGIKIIFK